MICSEIPWTVEQGFAEETARRNRQVYWGGLDGDTVEFSPFKASSDEAWQGAYLDIVYRRAHQVCSIVYPGSDRYQELSDHVSNMGVTKDTVIASIVRVCEQRSLDKAEAINKSTWLASQPE